MSIEISRLCNAVIAQNASDLHLNVGKRPAIRQSCRIVELSTEPLSAEDAHSLFKQIAPEANQLVLSSRGSTDFAFAYKEARFRVNACKSRLGIKLTLRRLPNKLLSVSEIGLPRQLVELTNRSRGLILVTGPTGSGKTTTLASLVKELSELGDLHIIMIEEPTEYVFEHGRGIVTQREVPTEVPSFEQGVIDALREDPDVIVVGEMRDLPTIRAAVSAAETGHLVLGTLHTTNAPETVSRILDAFPADERETLRAQLSMMLIGVFCQTLLPKKDGSGVVAAYEFMVKTPAIAAKIRDNKIFSMGTDIQTGSKLGMQLLDEHLFRLISSGVVDLRDAFTVAQDQESLAKRFAQRTT